MKRFGRWASIILLLFIVAVLLVFFLAGNWLETPAGRHLLQQELGKSLGVKAELEGTYALELFPGFRIDGQQLKLSDLAGGQALASLESYQLHLALLPLLKQRIDIHKVTASDGFVDLDLLAGQTEVSDRSTRSAGDLPSIRTLELAKLRVLQSTDDLLTIDYLQLDDFATGKHSSLRLGVSLPDDQSSASLAEMRGEVQVLLDPLSVVLDIDALSFRINDQAWPVGSGNLLWSQGSGEIGGMIKGNLAGYSSQVEFGIATRPELKGDFSARFLSMDQRSISANIAFSEGAGQWLFRPMELSVDGQRLAGQGCLSLDQRARLQVQLNATELDLDMLQSLLPAGLMTVNGSPQQASNPLPFDLAVEVVVGKARVSGAEATDVHLLLGKPPDCGFSALTDSQ